MNILKYVEFHTDRPTVFQMKKNECIQQFAVALGNNAILKKHKTAVPATLVMLKGEIKFTLPNEELILKALDFYEIPVEIEHEVTGLSDKNLFLITKDLNTNDE